MNCRKSPPVLTVCNDKGIPTEIEFEDEKKEESGGGGGGFHEILRNVGRRFSQPFGSHLRSKRLLEHLINKLVKRSRCYNRHSGVG